MIKTSDSFFGTPEKSKNLISHAPTLNPKPQVEIGGVRARWPPNGHTAKLGLCMVRRFLQTLRVGLMYCKYIKISILPTLNYGKFSQERYRNGNANLPESIRPQRIENLFTGTKEEEGNYGSTYSATWPGQIYGQEAGRVVRK